MEAARLDGIDLFADLPDNERTAVAGALRETTVDAGAALTSERDFGYLLFVIEEGDADVVVDGEVVRQLCRGETFGEIALLVTGRRTATVVARTPMRLLTLFDGDFQRIRRDIPAFEHSLRSLCGSRL